VTVLLTSGSSNNSGKFPSGEKLVATKKNVFYFVNIRRWSGRDRVFYFFSFRFVFGNILVVLPFQHVLPHAKTRTCLQLDKNTND